MEKTWTDQPDQVYAGSSVVKFSGMIQSHMVEVRHVHWQPAGTARIAISWYITVGNLFGSETVCCANAAQVLDVLQLIQNKRGNGKMNLPTGAFLVKNAEPA